MSDTRSLDVLLYHMQSISRGGGTDWEVGFARSILRQSKNASWRPSLKQENIMRRLVAERFEEDEDIDLFERVDA